MPFIHSFIFFSEHLWSIHGVSLLSQAQGMEKWTKQKFWSLGVLINAKGKVNQEKSTPFDLRLFGHIVPNRWYLVRALYKMKQPMEWLSGGKSVKEGEGVMATLTGEDEIGQSPRRWTGRLGRGWHSHCSGEWRNVGLNTCQEVGKLAEQ